MSQACNAFAVPCAAGCLCAELYKSFPTMLGAYKGGVMYMDIPVQAQCGWHRSKGISQRHVMGCSPFPSEHVLGAAENLRVELWGPFLTVSGTRKGGAMGMRDPARPSTGGKGVVLRREMDYGFFSASWRLPVSTLLILLQAKRPSACVVRGPRSIV